MHHPAPRAAPPAVEDPPATVPALTIGVIVAVTLCCMLGHGFVLLVTGIRLPALGIVTLAATGVLLVAWLPLIWRPLRHRSVAVAIASLGAVTAAIGANAYAATASTYWTAVLVLGLGALTQFVVRPGRSRVPM